MVRRIRDTATRRWTLMEVCGGQTHSISSSASTSCCPSDRADPRPGLPGLRDAARADRPRGRDRRAPRRDLLLLRRHAARARLGRRPARGEGARRRRAHRLLAARRGAARAAAPRAPGGLLRRRLRDHGAGQRHGGAPREAPRGSRTSRCWSRTCWCRRRSRRSSAARTPHRRAPGRGPRLHGDGLPRLRADRRPPPRADRRHRVRAARPPPGHPGGRAPARARRGARREPVRARGGARRQPGARAMVEEVFDGLGPQLARPRRDPAERPARSRRATGPSTPSRSSTSRAIAAASPRSAGPAWSCRAGCGPPNARPSASAARPSARSARPWSRPRAPARPTSTTGARPREAATASAAGRAG